MSLAEHGNLSAQNYSGNFELRGAPASGQLDLMTPFGQTVAQLRWGEGFAQLIAGGQSRNYSSAQELLEISTGAALSPETLFAWLNGQTVPEPQAQGWQVDLSRHSEGRIFAERNMGQPTKLRIALDQP